MASVEVRQVKKSFGKLEALKGVSFAVADGELFCLLGPPGTGKTTLLRIISGLERPNEGEILIGGEVMNAVPPQHRDVAMIFEDAALYPHLIGFDNIAYPLKLRKLPREEIQQRVLEVAKMLHIEHILDRRPATFSGGERRRLAIARALVRRPRVLLLDQPFADLDAKIRQEMATELKKLQTEVRQTMILATHDFEEGMIADRIAVMRLGEIHQIATPKEVYGKPATAFAAQFVGSPAMNLFRCSMESGEKGVVIKHKCFSVSLPKQRGADYGDVLLGIRPEEIVATEAGPILAQVEVIQVLGEEAIVDLKLADGTRFKWVVDSEALQQLERGKEVWLDFPRSSLHFYDAKTGERIHL